MPDPAGRRDVRAALDLAARAGAFFALDGRDGDGWRSLRDLVDDPAVVTDRVAAARAFLVQRTGADVELRACASVNALGVLSRLVSPALATAVLAGVVARLDLDSVAWRPVARGPLPVAVDTGDGVMVTTAAAAADAVAELVIEPVVRPVLQRYRTSFGVSPLTLWGNVASALAGAAGVLRTAGLPMRLDPDDVVAELLARGPVAGAGRYEQPFGTPTRVFVRTNCCLFYRVPAGGRCGDCVLVPAVARYALHPESPDL